MNFKNSLNRKAIRFNRFQGKSYSAFNSMHRVVNIGFLSICTLLIASTKSVQAQEVLSAKQSYESDESIQLDEVEITATDPSSIIQTARVITTINRTEIAQAPVNTITDLLKYTTGIDVAQRGEGGTQSDVSIRGGSSDQIAILLNGINLSNPQTGHYNFDLPVNISDIQRIEIIAGPSSRIYGGSAFSGAINIVTKPLDDNVVNLNAHVGSHKLYNIQASINNVSKDEQFKQQLSAGYRASDGYTENTDYKIANLFWQSNINKSYADFDIQVGFNDKNYGANSFYTPVYPDQHDHTTRFFVSTSAKTKGKIQLIPRVYWTKHYDCFKLFRYADEAPDWYKSHNYHNTQVFGANLNATTKWKLGQTTLGTEIRNENVQSNVLGQPLKKPIDVPFHKDAKYTKSAHRTNISYFLEHTFSFNNFNIALGALANYNTQQNSDFNYYPGIDLSYNIGKNITIYGNWNKNFRMPTFTELYYEDKANRGNPNLKPERSEAFEFGVKYQSSWFTGNITAFHQKGNNIIDGMKETPEDVWQYTNIAEVNNSGVENNLSFRPIYHNNYFIKFNRIDVGYTYTYQNKKDDRNISKYALNYLKHKFTTQINHTIGKNLYATWYFKWQDRAGKFNYYQEGKMPVAKDYAPYYIVNLKLNWKYKAFDFYSEINNLLNHSYYDFGNIPQAEMTFKVGMKYCFNY